MNEQYEKELNTLRKRMEQAEEFAEKFPHFANIIISNKYTIQDNWVRLSNFYKNMPFPWGYKSWLF
jgi:type VI protein secretion system component VasA